MKDDPHLVFEVAFPTHKMILPSLGNMDYDLWCITMPDGGLILENIVDLENTKASP